MQVYTNSKIGESYKNTKGELFYIIGYRNNKSVDIQFEDGSKVYDKTYESVKKGWVKNPNTRSVVGVGYMGIGKYKSRTNGKHNKDYVCWKSMLERCYSEKLHKRKPTYQDCYVCQEWHNFQNFADWFSKNYSYETMHKWQLDKDIIVPGNRVYGPDTCCFVPNDINNKSIYKIKNLQD